jgi:hypothetical protein
VAFMRRRRRAFASAPRAPKAEPKIHNMRNAGADQKNEVVVGVGSEGSYRSIAQICSSAVTTPESQLPLCCCQVTGDHMHPATVDYGGQVCVPSPPGFRVRR